MATIGEQNPTHWLAKSEHWRKANRSLVTSFDLFVNADVTIVKGLKEEGTLHHAELYEGIVRLM